MVSAKRTVELVDILEVIYRIFQLNGTSIERLEEYRKEKVRKNGAFEKIFF
jgi:predicted house-cleaning noncanonical NTP pyrophosphatase (MazG superfamily)